MKDFHSQLQDYIKRCPNVTAVAEASGINRTTLQHYMSGKRVPTKEETVLGIAKAMMLSPEERKMLLQAYSIAAEGEDVFGRREYIRDLITHLKNETISESRIVNDLTKYWELPDGKTVTEKTDLYKITRQLLEAAIAGGGELYFVVQPEFEFLFQLMASMHLESGQLKVEHIFGMKKTMAPQEDNMSLRCVKMILYVAPNFPDYQPYYFYDNRCDGRSYLSPAPFCMIYKDAF